MLIKYVKPYFCEHSLKDLLYAIEHGKSHEYKTLFLKDFIQSMKDLSLHIR